MIPNFLNRPGKLLQEPYIILEEQPDILDTVLQDGRALNAHAECKTGIFLAVDATILQNTRIYHPATQDLHPAGIFADGTSFLM